MNNLKDKIDALLMKVSKPTRYTGGELNSSIKIQKKSKLGLLLLFLMYMKWECLILDLEFYTIF